MTSCGVDQWDKCSAGSQRRQVEEEVGRKGWSCSVGGGLVVVVVLDEVLEGVSLSPGREKSV